MAKNYVEHDIEVKYSDGLIEKKEDWQWFIDIIEESYDIERFDSWEKYCRVSGVYRKVYEYFIRILEIPGVSCVFRKQEFEDLWEIAKYYNGILDLYECFEKISLPTSKLFLFCIWITRLSSKSINKMFIYDTRILIYHNFFQLYKLDSFVEEKEKLVQYVGCLSEYFSGIPLECLIDNIEMREHSYSSGFIEKYEDRLKNYNTFSFQSITIETPVTWQEAYLIDMIKVSIRDRKLIPSFSFKGESPHCFSLWTEDMLTNMRLFFNNDVAAFVIETVSYVLHKKELSHRRKLEHAQLLANAIEDKTSWVKVFGSSSFQICSYLFLDRAMKDCAKESAYISLLRSISQIHEPTYINKLRECGYPISKDQARILNEDFKTRFKKIESINDINDLEKYLIDSVVVHNVDDAHLIKTSETFNRIIASTKGIQIASIFYSYMVFLIQVNEKGKGVDRLWLQKEMIEVQMMWQTKYYNEQCKEMATFSHSEQVPHEKLTKFGTIVLENPIYVARDCTPSSEEELIAMMSMASEYPMAVLTKKLLVSPIYPKIGGVVEVQRHEVDSILMDKVKDIVENKGYKFLNILKPSEFMYTIHDCYEKYSQITISMFTRTEELYNLIRSKTEIEMLPFSESLCLGHITQLFPILEIKIRKLAALFDIFPFKKRLNEFMKYNDPSTLLREVLKKVNKSIGDWSLVPDLLFVYHLMYNSNSLNIRNECIHGRDYLQGERLTFAFKTTLIAIHIINFRIETIENGISDIRE